MFKQQFSVHVVVLNALLSILQVQTLVFQVPHSLPFRSSSVVNKVTEKLGRWLVHHSSRSDLSVSLNLGLQGGRNHGHGHGARVNSSSFMSTSRQTSTSDDCAFGGSTLTVLDAPGVRRAVTTSSNVPLTSSGAPTIRALHLPPLAELFSPQSMFVSDVESETPVVESSPSPPLVDDVNDATGVNSSPSLGGDSFRRTVQTGRRFDRQSMTIDSRKERPSTMNSKMFSVERAADDFGVGGAQQFDTPRRSCMDVGVSPSCQTHTVSHVDKKECLDEPISPTTSQEVARKRSSIDVCCGDERRASLRTTRRQQSADLPLEQCPTIGVIDTDGQLCNDTFAAPSSTSIERDRHKSGTSSCSRVSSDLYDRPESNQCTVTSLTPLLRLDDVADVESGGGNYEQNIGQ